MRCLLLLVLLCLLACTQQSWNDRIATPREQAVAVAAAEQLRAGQMDQLADETVPELRQQLVNYMKTIEPLLKPIRGDFKLQQVNSLSISRHPTSKSFIVQGGSGDHWAIIRLDFERTGGATRLADLQVAAFPSDPSKMEDFDIRRPGSLGYVWLAMMLTCASTCVLATVLIWRSRWTKHRWLWTIGSLFGCVSFGLNWSTGAWAIFFVDISFLGVQATKAGPYAPWLLSFAIPVVAIIVIIRWNRSRKLHQKVTQFPSS